MKQEGNETCYFHPNDTFVEDDQPENRFELLDEYGVTKDQKEKLYLKANSDLVNMPELKHYIDALKLLGASHHVEGPPKINANAS